MARESVGQAGGLLSRSLAIECGNTEQLKAQFGMEKMQGRLRSVFFLGPCCQHGFSELRILLVAELSGDHSSALMPRPQSAASAREQLRNAWRQGSLADASHLRLLSRVITESLGDFRYCRNPYSLT